MKYRIIKHGKHDVYYTATYEDTRGVWRELLYSDIGGVGDSPAGFDSATQARASILIYLEQQKKDEEDRNSCAVVEEGEV